MNRLLTPISYETALSDLKDSGGLNLSDQVTRQVILPVGNSSPDSGDASVISRLIRSDSSGSLLADRNRIEYSDIQETILNYTESPASTTVSWPVGYKILFVHWSAEFATTSAYLKTFAGDIFHWLDFDARIKIPGVLDDFRLTTTGTAGRTGTVYFWFLK